MPVPQHGWLALQPQVEAVVEWITHQGTRSTPRTTRETAPITHRHYHTTAALLAELATRVALSVGVLPGQGQLLPGDCQVELARVGLFPDLSYLFLV